MAKRKPWFGEDEHGPFCAVALTKGYVTKVDPEDSHLLFGHNWYAYQNVKSERFYARGREGQTRVMLHNKILPPEVGFTIDHISRDTLDNRKYNLRQATSCQQGLNKRMYKSNTSGHKGVSWNKTNKKWSAIVYMGGKRIHKCFDTKEEAINYRQAKHYAYHGADGQLGEQHG